MTGVLILQALLHRRSAGRGFRVVAWRRLFRAHSKATTFGYWFVRVQDRNFVGVTPIKTTSRVQQDDVVCHAVMVGGIIDIVLVACG